MPKNNNPKSTKIRAQNFVETSTRKIQSALDDLQIAQGAGDNTDIRAAQKNLLAEMQTAQAGLALALETRKTDLAEIRHWETQTRAKQKIQILQLVRAFAHQKTQNRAENNGQYARNLLPQETTRP